MRVKLTWRGDAVVREVLDEVVAPAMGEIGLRVEGAAKRNLWKGHGVLTGTLRRSIHTAEPGYDWAGDDVTPSDGSPERGGRKTVNVQIEVGSGLWYAMAVHQGHGGFAGYHYLTDAVDAVRGQVAAIIRRYARG